MKFVPDMRRSGIAPSAFGWPRTRCSVSWLSIFSRLKTDVSILSLISYRLAEIVLLRLTHFSRPRRYCEQEQHQRCLVKSES